MPPSMVGAEPHVMMHGGKTILFAGAGALRPLISIFTARPGGISTDRALQSATTSPVILTVRASRSAFARCALARVVPAIIVEKVGS